MSISVDWRECDIGRRTTHVGSRASVRFSFISWMEEFMAVHLVLHFITSNVTCIFLL